MPLHAPNVPVLRVGANAPSLSAVRWIKRGPPTPGRLRVVEFWATWCAPCRDNFPNLTRLAKRYAGQVDVVGIDVWERRHAEGKGGDFGPAVRAFVALQGGRMGYRVGMDRTDGATARAWLDAAKAPGIPTAFVIDAKGRVAWIGNGYATEDAVEAVLAGAKDPARSVAAAGARRQAVQARFEDAARRGDLKTVLALRPALSLNASLDTAYGRLADRDPAAAHALAEAAIADPKPGMWTYLELTWALVSGAHRRPDDGALAVRLAKEGLRRADPSDEARYACLSYLAQAHSMAGDSAKAAEVEAEVVALLDRLPSKTADDVMRARKRLEAYRAGQKPDDRPDAAATKTP